MALPQPRRLERSPQHSEATPRARHDFQSPAAESLVSSRPSGAFPPPASSRHSPLDHVGIITRDVADLALVFEAIVDAGAEPSPPALHETRRESTSRPTGPRTAARPSRGRSQARLKRYQQPGATLNDGTVIAGFDDCLALLATTVVPEAWLAVGKYVDEYPTSVPDALVELLAGASDLRATEYVAAQEARATLGHSVDAALTECDVIAVPTPLRGRFDSAFRRCMGRAAHGGLAASAPSRRLLIQRERCKKFTTSATLDTSTLDRVADPFRRSQFAAVSHRKRGPPVIGTLRLDQAVSRARGERPMCTGIDIACPHAVRTECESMRRSETCGSRPRTS